MDVGGIAAWKKGGFMMEGKMRQGFSEVGFSFDGNTYIAPGMAKGQQARLATGSHEAEIGCGMMSFSADVLDRAKALVGHTGLDGAEARKSEGRDVEVLADGGHVASFGFGAHPPPEEDGKLMADGRPTSDLDCCFTMDGSRNEDTSVPEDELDAERFEEAVRDIPPHIILEMGCKEEFGAQGFREFKEAGHGLGHLFVISAGTFMIRVPSCRSRSSMAHTSFMMSMSPFLILFAVCSLFSIIFVLLHIMIYLRYVHRKAGTMNMGRKYKLDDSLIFKPVKQQLTPEEEMQAKKDLELFLTCWKKRHCFFDESL